MMMMGNEEESIPSASVHSTTQASVSGQSTSTSEGSGSSLGLAKEETKAVKRSKILVFAVILVAAAVVGALIYVLVDREEKDDFEASVSERS